MNNENSVKAIEILLEAYNRQTPTTHYTDDFKIVVENGTIRVRVYRRKLKHKVERVWSLQNPNIKDVLEAVSIMEERGLITK